MSGTSMTCPSCGHTQTLGVTFTDVTVADNAGGNIGVTCERCSTTYDAAPADGTYSTVGGRLQLVRALSAMDREEMVRLHAALQQALDASPDEAVEEVEKASSPVANWLSDRENRKELRDSILALMAVLSVLIASMTYRQVTRPPAEEVQRVVVQVENGEVLDSPMPLRGPCWCGSGKRLKNCHDPRGTRLPGPPPAGPGR